SRNNYDILKASCSIPIVCRPYSIGGVPYYDGAISDPVPIEKAFSLGCEKVVLILTRPRDFLRTPDKDRKLAAGLRKKYPLAAARLEQRAERYNEGIILANQYERQGKLLIVAPDDTCGMDTLTRNPEAMKRFYEKGLQDGGQIAAFVK
ncbi:MAG: patatin-like phospholipase family protein, partial [Clostridiales bacterium]|nr:patatin-like phospholipase family protein [Clostridiales bacterium]